MASIPGSSGNTSSSSTNGSVTAMPRAPPRQYIRIKILSGGDGGSGKSCLIKRYCEQKFVTRYISTIGVDFGVRVVPLPDGKDLKVNFWDLSGQPEFFQVRSEFYANTQGMLLVYDMTSVSSFACLPQWLRECKQFSPASSKPPIVALCANKSDMKKKRVVSEEQGRKFATDNGFTYFETSAKTGENVNEMFAFLFQAVVQALPRAV